MADIYVSTTGNDSTGTGSSGNPYLTPGKAGAVHSAGDKIWIKSGSYTITSATPNVAGGCLQLLSSSDGNFTRVAGYGTTAGDFGTPPVITASGISTFTMVDASANFCWAENLTLDGASLTGSRGANVGGNAAGCYKLKVSNCKNNGIAGADGPIIFCEVTGCATQPAVYRGGLFACWIHDNTITGWQSTNGAGDSCAFVISSNNTGGSSKGFDLGRNNRLANCVAYGNGSDGVVIGASPGNLVNVYAENNGGYGFNVGGLGAVIMQNCGGYNNTSGNVNAPANATNKLNFATLSATAFTNAAGNDFSLNTGGTGGALLRALGFPGVYPGGFTTGYVDIGGAQHQDSGGGGSTTVLSINGW